MPGSGSVRCTVCLRRRLPNRNFILAASSTTQSKRCACNRCLAQANPGSHNNRVLNVSMTFGVSRLTRSHRPTDPEGLGLHLGLHHLLQRGSPRNQRTRLTSTPKRMVECPCLATARTKSAQQPLNSNRITPLALCRPTRHPWIIMQNIARMGGDRSVCLGRIPVALHDLRCHRVAWFLAFSVPHTSAQTRAAARRSQTGGGKFDGPSKNTIRP